MVSTVTTLALVAAAPGGAWAATGTDSSADTVANCKPATAFDRRDFSYPTRIDNKWLPLVPGTQYVLEGRANRGGGPLPHQVIFTVTDLTKVINGVQSRVIWDRDINEDQLSEAELSFQAQDDDRNVWNMGEYPEEYEDGVFVGAPNTWISGLAHAKAGIGMLSRPRLGTPRYLQGSAPEIDFLDCAQVFATGQQVDVPFHHYDNVLVTDENSPLDPASGHQRKFYAPGVGNVKITPVNDPEGETLVLVDLVHLSPSALAHARAEALKLDRHAYQVSEVYTHTPPARRG